MLMPVFTRQFEKDVKRCRERGKNSEKFKRIVQTLVEEQQLDLYTAITR